MNRELELNLIDRMLRKIENVDCDLPSQERWVDVDRYVSPRRFDVEMNRAFKRFPSLLIHSSELPQSKSFVTMDHFGRSILLCRDEHGDARGFLNICRHRGAKLENARSGCRNRFICGYHAWTYDTSGRLASIPSSFCFPNVHPGERNLIPINVVEAYGFVWLMSEPGKNRSDLDRFLGPLLDDFAALQLQSYEVYGFESMNWDINWKLVVEGTLEGYHFPVLHHKSAHTIFEENAFFFDPLGLHLRSVLPKRTVRLIGKKVREEWSLCSMANIIYTVFPNETILHQSDHFLWITPHPISPKQTLVKLRLLIPRASAQNEDADSWKANKELTYLIQNEDLEIYQSIQQGFTSGANQKNCFGRNEHALAHFNDNLDRYLGVSNQNDPNVLNL